MVFSLSPPLQIIDGSLTWLRIDINAVSRVHNSQKVLFTIGKQEVYGNFINVCDNRSIYKFQSTYEYLFTKYNIF